MEIIPIISFFTGVISVLSPCILPILPIFVSVSLNFDKKSLFSYISGFISVFIIIILLTGFFTSIIYSYITYVRLISAIVLLIIGIIMFFDVSIVSNYLPQLNASNYKSSFMLGLLTSVAWAPCYSGYLISLIALLVGSNDGGYAIINLVIYCIGFGLTLLVLSYMISKINLERLISKTSYIPKIFAILIILGAMYLLYAAIIPLI